MEIEREGEQLSRLLLDGKPVEADAVQVTPHTISVLLKWASLRDSCRGHCPTENLKLQTGPHEFIAEVQDPRAWRGRRHSALEVEGRQQIVAPMPGKVVRLLVKAVMRWRPGKALP